RAPNGVDVQRDASRRAQERHHERTRAVVPAPRDPRDRGAPEDPFGEDRARRHAEEVHRRAGRRPEHRREPRGARRALRRDELGVEGEPVLILVPSSLEFLVALLGTIAAGGIAAPAYPPSERGLPRLDAILETTRARIAITTRTIRNLIDAASDFVPAIRSMT